MSLRPEQRVVCNPRVLSRVLDGEAVLLCLATGSYFGLDPVGTRVWELASEHKTIGEIRQQLLEEFDVQADVLDRDLAELVEELCSRDLASLDGA